MEKLEVTSDNYFKTEINKKYLSVSTIKSIQECEVQANAKLHKGYVAPGKNVFVQGHYLHSWNEGTLEDFKAKNPSLYSTRGATAGQLKAEFRKINDVIEFLEQDKNFMAALAGEKEQIFTGKLFGIPFKIMVDSLNIKNGFFTDLKFMKSIRDKFWNSETKERENFVEHYNYVLQMAVYQAVIKKNTELLLEPYIAAVDKTALGSTGGATDKELISFEQEDLDIVLKALEKDLEHIVKVWKGEVKEKDLKGCGVCNYCKSIRKIEKPIDWKEL